MLKLNCWEFEKCGGGSTCPSVTEIRLDGVHGGKAAGRACWVIAGTLCKGKAQGEFALKLEDCIRDCDFYKLVRKEEGPNFQTVGQLLKKMQD